MDFIFVFLSNLVITLSELGAQGPFYVFWFLLKNGGWFFVLFSIWPFLKDIWLDWRQNKYAATVKWSYLAIDVPRDNEQSPKAVEQIFNQLWGYKSGANLWEKWWKGIFLQSMSLEIVSVEGYIQYIIRTPSIFRDLVESAIYAQYPEADITEIEDYTKDFTPDNFREKGYKMWGSQFALVNKDYYPIKTYPSFEHSITQKIIDPLAAMLEMMSKLGRGEQMWYQIVIRAEDDSWKKDADELVKKLIGVEVKKKKSLFDSILAKVYETFGFMFPGYKPETSKAKDVPSNVLYMSKGELDTVNAIEIKSSKTGYRTKIRMIYFGKEAVFSKTRGVSPFVGALRQYAANNLNGFKPAGKTTTKADYFQVDKRVYKKQRKILAAYKSRSMSAGENSNGYILNVEELASLYHFPTKEVSTTAVRTAESKKAPAPMGVPEELLEEIFEPEAVEVEQKNEDKKITTAPPGNLPI